MAIASEILQHLGMARIPDAIAPDGSEIRLLPALQNGAASVVHCTLPTNQASLTISHKTVEEIWFFTRGTGEIWRNLNGQESLTAVTVGDSLNIPLGTKFQFRNTGPDELECIIVTSPPWPGEDEAQRESDYWQTA